MFEYLIAFGAGLISFLSPCVLPLIPGYVSYISGQSLQEIIESKKTTENKDKSNKAKTVAELDRDKLEKKFSKKNIAKLN